MRRNIWRIIFSGLSVASLLINSLLPVSLANRVYAQESTPSTTPIPTILPSLRLPIDPSLTSTSSASPELSPDASLSIPQLVDPTTSDESASLSRLSRDETPLLEDETLPEEIKDQQDKNYVEGEVIVKFKKSRIDIRRTLGKVQAYVFEQKFSLDKTDEIRASNIQVFRSEKSTEEMVEELKSDPNVEYVQPNYIYEQRTIETNDAYKDQLWGLDNADNHDIDAPEAWALSEGSGDVIVAVIDDGVAYNHPDLLNNMWDGSNCKDENGITIGGGCNHGYDYEKGDNTPLPTTSSHGTHIAGTIAAAKNNGIGIIGVAPRAKIMAVKVLLTSSQVTKGINFAKQNGAKIINASWGSYGTGTNSEFHDPYLDHSLYNAISSFPGLFVVAAGNEAFNHDDGLDGHKSYPDGFKLPTALGPGLDNIIVVAATDQSDGLAISSDYGQTSVDVGAPGTDIYSTEGYRIFDEDFEGVTPPSTGTKFTQSGSNTWGTLSNGSNKAVFGDYAHWGNYRNNILSKIDSSVINLGGKLDSYLNFDVFCDSESGYDGIILYFWNGSAWVPQGGYSGLESSQEEKSLLSFAISNFQFRFVWFTDESNPVPYRGCYVDNIKAIDPGSNDGSYQFMDGTSMAAPHVAGLAALIWGYKPDLTLAQVKDTILQTGDSIPDLDPTSGTHPISTGKRINAFNALQSLLPPPNQPPVLDPIGNQSVDELVNLNFTVTATDPEDNPLTYSLSGEPNGAAIDSSSGAFNWTPTEAQGPGDHTFTIQVSDGSGIDSKEITVTVAEVNQAPVADSDLATTDEDTAKTITLSAADSDLPVQSLTYVIVSGVSHGFLGDISGNQVTYTPNPNYNGADSFTFKANDGTVDGNVATVSVTVNAVNDAPVISMTAPTTATEGILYAYDANFNDPEGSVGLVWSTTVSDTCGGTIDSLTGVYTFTPAGPVPSASCVLEIKVNDGGTPDLSDTETTTITIVAVNDAPTITTTAPTTATEDTPYTYDADVSDPDGPGVTWSKTPSDTCGGNLDSSTGVYAFTPLGPVPLASCVLGIEVSDEGTPTLSASQTATIIINTVNEAPIVAADGYSTSEDITLNVAAASGVLANDSDADSSTLFVVLLGGVSHGTLTLNTNGSFVYNPALNYNGADSFTYKASDGTANSNTATVSITVIPVNDAPIAQADNGSVNEDTTLIIAKNTLLANDSDIDGDSLTLTGLANPAHGTVSVDTENVVFVPAADFSGIASFDYTVSDGDLTDTATVTVTVNPVNDAPAADPQSVLANEDAMVTIDLSGSDVEGDSLTYAIVAGVDHGTLSSLTGNRLTYTPSANYAGSDPFTFKVNDGQLDSSPATVSITVTSFNDPPILDSIGNKTVDELTNLTFIATATDPDSSLTYSLINAPAGATIDPDSGVLNFTPTEAQGPREYTLTVNVTDGASNDSEEITITVNEVNSAPVVLDDNISTNEDAAKTITLRAADFDLPVQILTYSIVSGVSYGTLGAISGDRVTYTPKVDYNGADSFTFKANDGMVDSNVATVSITINPPPVISNEDTDTLGETGLTITWTTDHPSTSRVIYDTVSHAVLGAAPNYGYSDSTVETDASPKVTSHSVTIDGLTAGTTYYYRVVSQGSPEVVGDENSFTTTDVAVEQSPDNGTTAGTTTSPSTELATGVDGGAPGEITEGSAPGVLGKETITDAVHEDKKAVQKGADLVNNEPEVLGQSKSNGNKWPLLGIILLIGIVSFYFYKRKTKNS